MKQFLIRLLYVLVLILLITSTTVLTLFGYIDSNYQYSRYTSNNFTNPTEMVQPPGHTGSLIVSQKDGLIYNVTESGDKSVFLDLTSKVTVSNEDGLLGMAFHPDYPQDQRFFTFYSEKDDSCSSCFYTVLSSFQVENGVADIDSEIEYFRLFQPHLFHRGGRLTFDLDGMLLIGVGDGTQQYEAQNLSSLYGSIMRINVDIATNATMQYSIPEDNPYYGNTSVRQEIYVHGVRNPFRGSLDRETGDYWFGDVGGDFYEEINYLQAGANYGWPYFEGEKCNMNCETIANYTLPELAYPHPSNQVDQLGIQFTLQDRNIPYGIAIVGTVMYRGSDLPDLYDKIVFVDLVGSVYSFDPTTEEVEFVTRFSQIVSSVWQDAQTNELYFTALDTSGISGKVYSLRASVDWIFVSLIITILTMILLPIYRKYL